jgi:hypothetical protein
VERAGQTIFNWSRALLLHYILHWPQEARLELWPFAVDYAVWIWNHLPDLSTRLSPIEVFTQTTFDDNKHLKRTRVFGCPVYVLHPTLQDARKLPKWQKKSWRGVFLGFSPNHSSNVILVLNPETGSITPQYHVVFDEKFFTTSTSTDTDADPATSVVTLWDNIRDEGYDLHDSLEGPRDAPLPPDVNLEPAVSPTTDAPTPELPPAIEMQADVFPEMNDLLELPQPDAPTNPEEILQVEPPTGIAEDPDELPMSTIRTTRSGREVQTPQRLRDLSLLSILSKQTYFAPSRNLPRVRCEVLNRQRLSTLRWDNLLTSLRSGSYGSLVSFVRQHSEDGYIEEWHPSLLATKANAEDNPTWNEAMTGPFSQLFK